MGSTRLQDTPVLWSVLGDYEASIAESSHRFSFPAVNFDDDSMLVLVIDGSSSASFNLGIRFNKNSSSYFVDGRRITGGGQTLIDLNGQTFGQIASTSVIAGVDRPFSSEIYIHLNKAGAIKRINCNYMTMGGQIGIQEVATVTLLVNKTNVTDIDILTSTSTWKIGTRMTLYKVARK